MKPNYDMPDDYVVLEIAIDDFHAALENWLALLKQMERDKYNSSENNIPIILESARYRCEITFRQVAMVSRFAPECCLPGYQRG